MLILWLWDYVLFFLWFDFNLCIIYYISNSLFIPLIIKTELNLSFKVKKPLKIMFLFFIKHSYEYMW